MAANLKRMLCCTMAATCLWATGCANLTGVAPGTLAADVASSRGKPFRVWPEANGASSWEYPMGPMGHYTYMVRVGADGRVSRVDQVLDWPYFNTLTQGMKADEIEHVLGRPYRTSYMPMMAENVMTWRWIETIWPRCFFAYLDPAGRMLRTGVKDEEVGDTGMWASSPC